MQVINRLKMELANQNYFEDTQYMQFLEENNLNPISEYNKPIIC